MVKVTSGQNMTQKSFSPLDTFSNSHLHCYTQPNAK